MILDKEISYTESQRNGQHQIIDRHVIYNVHIFLVVVYLNYIFVNVS